MQSDGTETGKSVYPSLGLGNSFSFKFEDLKQRVHRINCGELFIFYIYITGKHARFTPMPNFLYPF